MTPEAKAKAEIKQVLKEFGCWYFMPMMNGYGRAGIPDFIGCWRGIFFAIEAKAEDGVLTPQQARELESIGVHGGDWCVAFSGKDAREFLNAIALQRKA